MYVGLASPIRVKFLFATNGTASLIASHTYFATQLGRHPQWSQSLKIFRDNDSDGVDLTTEYTGTPVGEAFGEAEVPITIPAVNHAIKLKLLLKGNPFEKKSPFVEAREYMDEPVMGILGMDFVRNYVTQWGCTGMPPPEMGTIGMVMKDVEPFCAWCLDSSPGVKKAKCGGTCGGRSMYCRGRDCQKKDWKAYHSHKCSKSDLNGLTPYLW